MVPSDGDRSLGRIIRGIHPREVADGVRVQEDLPEAWPLGIDIDAGKVPVEPLGDLPEHEVIVRCVEVGIP